MTVCIYLTDIGFHMVVRITGGGSTRYFDPSYGLWTPSATNLQSVLVEGFQTGDVSPDRKSLTIIQSTAALIEEIYPVNAQ